MMKNDWISVINWAREWADDQDEELELIESIVKVKNLICMTNEEIFHLWDCLGCMERSLAADRFYRQLEGWADDGIGKKNYGSTDEERERESKSRADAGVGRFS